MWVPPPSFQQPVQLSQEGGGEASRPAAVTGKIQHCQVPVPLLVLRIWGRPLVAVPCIPYFY